MGLSPEINEAILELADVHYQLGEADEAMEAIKMAEDKNLRPGQTAFLKGLILLKMDKNSEAMESFTKAKEASPGLAQAADYQIGQALLKQNRLWEAEERFNEVVIKDPNTDMAAFSSHFIEKIDKKKREQSPYHYYAGVHFQYDDNVVLKPSDSDAARATGISGKDDYREVFTAGFEYVPVQRKPIDISAHYSFYYSNHHDLNEYDVMSHTIAIVPSEKIDKTAVTTTNKTNFCAAFIDRPPRVYL